MSLHNKLLTSLAIIILGSLLLIEVIGYQRSRQILLNTAIDQAREVRALLMSVRRVYHQEILESGIPLNDQTLNLLPAHTLSSISNDFHNWSEFGLSFNNVSDRPRNPANRADPLEREVMEYFRQHPKEQERVTSYQDDKGENYLHFGSPIWVEPYCLKCHGDEEQAPETIRRNFQQAYGYREGDLRGLVSIRIPLKRLQQRLESQRLAEFAGHLLAAAIIFLLSSWGMRHLVTHRLERLQRHALQIRDGDYPIRYEAAGNDEIDRLARSFNQMASALGDRESRLRQGEERYRTLAEQLEQKVIQRTQELQQSNRELESFSYSVSHDLQAPLRAIRGYSEALREDHAGQLDDEARNYLERLHHNAFQMSGLIDGLLELSRSTRGELQPEECDLSAMAEELARDLAVHCGSHCRFDIQAGLKARGDRRLLRTLLFNLLENAVKYSRKCQAPEIRVYRDGDEFVVQDNGAGFDPARREELFQPFHRLHDPASYPGIGISLATVARIIHRHSGSIRAEGSPGQGARFIFGLESGPASLQ